ncbi:MAG: amidase family protein, partial [Qipengyuania pacifica]
DAHVTDFTTGLADASLKGVRIGVLVNQIGDRDDVRAIFETALDDLRRAGADLVEIAFEPSDEMGRDEFATLLYELRTDMNAYLATLPGKDMPRSLADLIAFNKANAAEEMRWFDQGLFEMAVERTDEQAYRAARKNALHLAADRGIDRLLEENQVALLVVPTRGPAWTSDLVNGDNFDGSIGAGSLAAIAGYPHLTVPMGAVERLPVGISFMGPKWSDHLVLKAGAAYESARTATIPEPSLQPWSPGD